MQIFSNMDFKTFFTYLLYISATVALLIYSMQYISQLSSYSDLSWFSYAFFNLFSLLLYYGAVKTVKSENLHSFSNFFLLATISKLFFCLAIVVVYFYKFKPSDQYFIIPFFLIYIFYTIFEVYFMSIIGKTNQVKDEIDL
jgi:hypothetical protein